MKKTVKVLSCNLQSGAADARSLADAIESHAVDVVCAQELSKPLAGTISEILVHGDLSHDQVHRGSGTASRHPVSVGRIATPMRDSWHVALEPEHWSGLDRRMEILNVHISAPHLWPYFPRRVRRSVQLAAVMDYWKRTAETPHAVVGDFNSTPLWAVYRKMASVYADGALNSGNPHPAIGGTWPYMPGIGIKGLIRIDHCFLWKLSARQVQTIEIAGTDHLGLLVELAVAD